MTTKQKTDFEIVARPRIVRLGRKRAQAWFIATALVAVAGLVAAASLTVNQRNDTSSLYAERFNVAENFQIAESKFYPSHVARTGIGTAESPEEMTIGMADVRTDLLKDQWVYTVVVREVDVNIVQKGEFAVELTVDGVLYGHLRFKQGTNDPVAVEGVRASFGIGAELSTSALYYVVVKPVEQPANIVDYKVKSVDEGGLKWKGVGGSIDGQLNPAITVAPGAVLRLTAVHGGDGGGSPNPHNIGILDSADQLVNPPGWSPNIQGLDQEKSISWTAVAGTFKYRCQYHPSMEGTITVA